MTWIAIWIIGAVVCVLWCDYEARGYKFNVKEKLVSLVACFLIWPVILLLEICFQIAKWVRHVRS